MTFFFLFLQFWIIWKKWLMSTCPNIVTSRLLILNIKYHNKDVFSKPLSLVGDPLPWVGVSMLWLYPVRFSIFVVWTLPPWLFLLCVAILDPLRCWDFLFQCFSSLLGVRVIKIRQLCLNANFIFIIFLNHFWIFYLLQCFPFDLFGCSRNGSARVPLENFCACLVWILPNNPILAVNRLHPLFWREWIALLVWSPSAIWLSMGKRKNFLQS